MAFDRLAHQIDTRLPKSPSAAETVVEPESEDEALVIVDLHYRFGLRTEDVRAILEDLGFVVTGFSQRTQGAHSVWAVSVILPEDYR